MTMQQSRQPNLKALRLYLRYWQRYWKLTLTSILFSISVAVQTTVVPLMVAIVLGQLIRSHTINFRLLVFTAVFQLITVGLCYLTDARGIAILHHHVEEDLYEDSFEYLVQQDYSFFTNRFSGSVVTQASRFAKIYTIFNDTMFFDLLPQIFAVIIALGVMMYYSLPLGLTVAVLWAFSVWVVIKFALQRLPLRRGAVAKESEQVGELADMITNALTVKTFAAEDREMRRYRVINKVRSGLFLQSWRRAVRNVWIVETLCAGLQTFMFVGGIIAVKHNAITVATFLLFQVYILRIIDSIRRSSMMVRQLEVVAGDAQEMTELLEEAPLVQDIAQPEPSHITSGAINFKAMTFHYADAGQHQTLFESFDLSIKPGEKIGLVGPSGGGKTTITRLLLRFMDIQSGAIMIDGQNINAIKQQDLRKAIAYVPQEPLLFHRSIKENIAYARPAASDAEIIDVAKKAFAHDFIAELPEQYDTLVGERGVKLSGGQRQRVAIARAMLSGAPILILDEATSALDSESEVLIQKALWELMKDKTAVVIAHRLSTIQRLDRIVVIDKGQIIEQGSHKTLLKQKGLYAKLWAHQSGGFIEE
jgi:ATP-binding cassette subfamily B protein